MTKLQAQELVRRYFQVKLAAKSEPFEVPALLDEAKQLLTAEEIAGIEADVNTKGNVKS